MKFAQFIQYDLPRAMATGLAYFITALACLHVGETTAGFSALWVPNAVALCALICFRPARAASIVVACVIAGTAANLGYGKDFALSLVFALANMTTWVIADLVLRKCDVGPSAFETRQGTGHFLSALVLAVPFGATLAAVMLASRGTDFVQAWLGWAIADFLGTLIVSAFILTAVRLGKDPSRIAAPGRRSIPATMLVVVLVSAMVFSQSRFPLLFLPLIAVLFATFRLGRIGAVGGVLIVAACGSLFLMMDRGPISLIHSPAAIRIQFFQFYLAAIFATCLPVAVLLAERRLLMGQRLVSERRHRALVERSHEVIFETDLAGRWTYLNPAWEAVTGQTVAAAAGTSFLSMIAPEDRADALERLAPLYTRDIDMCHQELRFLHASGEVRWASVRSHLLIDSEGGIVGTHGTLHDITRRRLMEQAQRESESLYRLLAENSNDMIVRLDLQGVRKYVSPASVQLLGYEPHELIGLNPAGEIHPDDRATVVTTCLGLIAGDPRAVSVYRQRRKDGVYAWLEANYRLIRDEHGSPVEAIASVRDVSRREAAEIDHAKATAQLRESHRLLLMSEEMGQIGHWRLDLASQTVFWSDAVCAIHGVPAGHSPPLDTAIDFYHPDDRATTAALVERTLADGEDFTSTARIVRPDGSIRHIMSRGRAEKAPDGTIIGLVGVFQDVTAGRGFNDMLRQSEHRYKMLSDHATDIVVRLGSRGECLFVSPSVAEVAGFTPADLLDRRLGSRIHPDDRTVVRRTVSGLWDVPGPSGIVEFRYRHRDGHWLWLEANLRATPDPVTGIATDLIGSVRLIDRRKAAEATAEQARQKLDDSNRLLKMAEGVAHLGHWRIDAASRSLMWSDEVFAIYGLSPDTVPTIENTLALYHPDDVDRVRGIVDRALANGTGYSSQARIVRPDGKLVHILSRSEIDRDAHGTIIGFFGIVQDVTEQREAEELLEEREARFRLITEQASDMISLHDADGRVMFMSPAARAIIGYEPEEMIGTTVWDYALSEDHDILVDHRRRMVEQAPGTVSTSRFRMRHRDGDAVWIEVASRLVAYDGQHCSIRVCRDVSQQVRVEAELREARAAAEAATAAKSSFLATMSHEIRTPMTGVLGMVELLRADVDPAQRDRFFDTLEQSAKTLMTVLDDILDFSKIEAGNLALETVDFDLAALAHSVGDLFGNAASAKGLTLAVQVSAPRIDVKGDPTRIRQILSNLVSNAIKFTETGSVAVAIAPSAIAGCADRWRIEVIDSGIGVDPATGELLFSPFVQADPSTTRRFGGTGLGLSISKRLTTAMGGEIGVARGAQGGSIFWFELPLEAGRPVIAEPPRHAPNRNAAGPVLPLRVLVAEDNEVNQLLLTALLRRVGHEAVCVANGELAVAGAVAGGYDVILMDMQMPVMDGVAATRAIRSLAGPASDIPIIALTADALPERRRFYENIGLTGFLTKPVDVAQLTAVLAGIVVPAAREDAALPATIDGERLAELRSVVGEDTVATLLDLIVRDAAQRPAAIRAALDAGDVAAATGAAHALYGAAINVGAARLAQAARAIEQADDGDSARLALPELEAAARALVSALDPITPAPAAKEQRR